MACMWSIGATRQTILKVETESVAYMYNTDIQQQVLQQVGSRLIIAWNWNKLTIIKYFPILLILSSCTTT